MTDVRLRDVVHADLEVFFAQEHDPEAAARSKFPPRPRERFMTHWETRVLGDPTVHVQAVTVDGTLAGSIVAWWDGERRYIGYWFGREWWGKGIGTRALRLFLERETVRPLYADPVVTNTGSVRLAEKCGFVREEVVRDGDNEYVVLVLR